ncbi:MAG: MBL fold metallo-hydrolase [Deltaproteobacteria bacterium]|nr:MBL fold metallo-hydrolase [Deltaproteobacteria bacterium]
MKLHTLGTGGPRIDATRASACHVLEAAGQTLMFDVGRGAIHGVGAKEFPLAAIGHLFISHHHVDHIGEFANYLITSWIEGRRRPLKVYGPPGTAQIADTLFRSVYDRDIAFRTEGETAFGPFIGADITEMHGGQRVEGDGWRARCEEVEHGHGLPFGPDFRGRWTCLAWRFEAEGKVFSFSGDAVMCKGLLKAADSADLHLQCCYLPASKLVTKHMKAVGRYTLACSDTAGKIAAKAGVGRLLLTHFNKQTTQEMADEIAADVRLDYAGPVELSNDLDHFEF